MKTIFKYILSILLIVAIASCSDKPAESTITSISISVNQNNINLGESFTFSVVDNSGKTVQSGLVIYVNNVTFKHDIGIIIKTILKVIKREGISSTNSATMEKFEGSSDNK